MRAAVLLAAFLVPGVTAGAGSPDLRREYTSIAFWDGQSGLASSTDWGSCRLDSHCRARLLVTNDGGRSWRAVRSTFGPLVVSTVPRSRVAFAYSDRSGGSRRPRVLLRTTDAGRSWHSLPWRNVSGLAFATPRVGWVVRGLDPPSLFGTRDGGRTWRRLGPCAAWELYVALPDVRRGWAVCAAVGGTGQQPKRFFATADGGRTWRVRATAWPLSRDVGRGLPIVGYPRGLSFTADGHGWMWEARGPLVATGDGGQTWRNGGLPGDGEAVSATRVDERLGFALLRNRRGMELVVTRNGGRKWSTVRLWPW